MAVCLRFSAVLFLFYYRFYVIFSRAHISESNTCVPMFYQPLPMFARSSFQTKDVTGFSGGVAPAAAVYDCRDFRLLFTSCSMFRPRPPRTVSSFIVVMLLLVAGVEPNPGPRCARTSSVNFGLLNARSVVSKAAHIHDVISDLHLDVLAVTETWVTNDAPDAIKLDVAHPVTR